MYNFQQTLYTNRQKKCLDVFDMLREKYVFFISLRLPSFNYLVVTTQSCLIVTNFNEEALAIKFMLIELAQILIFDL